MHVSQADSKRSLRIHVWVPELVSKRGGIQTFSRCLIEAAVEIVGRENVQVMAKNDPREMTTRLRDSRDHREAGSRKSEVSDLNFSSAQRLNLLRLGTMAGEFANTDVLLWNHLARDSGSA